MASSGSEGLRFWVDFASPYAWLAFDELYRIGEAAGLEVELKPILLWAVLKEQALPAPMANAGRRDYMMADMARSAAYLGLPLVIPEPFQISTHAAARLFYGVALRAPASTAALARALFLARFQRGEDLSQAEVLRAVAAPLGFSPDAVDQLIAAPESRAALAEANAAAVARGIFGVPFIELGEEGFFGADRLAHLRWRLGL